MQEGFVVDNTHRGQLPAAWVEGKPVKSIWSGTSLRGKTKLQIASWRCERCGFLENYAKA
jgi:hypothetical protein